MAKEITHFLRVLPKLPWTVYVFLAVPYITAKKLVNHHTSRTNHVDIVEFHRLLMFIFERT